MLASHRSLSASKEGRVATKDTLMRWKSSCLIVLPLAILGGCESAPPAAATAAAPAAAIPSAPSAVAAPSKAEQPELPKPARRPVRRERPPAERAKVAQLFQVPQVTRASTASYSEGRQQSASAPQIRLLGFSQLDGVLRALVHVKGEVLQVEQGDVIDGAEVVAIDVEGVSFQYSGTRWTEPLFHREQSPPVVVAKATKSSTPPQTPQAAEASESAVAPFPAPVN
jgi:hypothetical protein